MAVAATVADSGVARTLARAPARRGPDIIHNQAIPLSAVSDDPVEDVLRPPLSTSSHPDDLAAGVAKEITAEELAAAEAARKPAKTTPKSASGEEPEADKKPDDTVDPDDDTDSIDSDKFREGTPAFAQREITKTRNAARKARADALALVDASKAEAAAAKKIADDAIAEAARLRKETDELRTRPAVEEAKPDPRPTRDQFDDPDTFDEALTAWGIKEGERVAEARQREAQAVKDAETKAAKDEADRAEAAKAEELRQADVAKVYAEWETQKTAAIEKYPDFEAIALAQPDEGGPIVTEAMGAAVMQIPNGVDVLYFLGQNTDEAERIAGLTNPVRQLIEIGRLSQKLETPTRRAVPRPIVPLDTQRSAPGDNQTEAEPDMESYAKARNAKLAGDRKPFFPPSQYH